MKYDYTGLCNSLLYKWHEKTSGIYWKLHIHSREWSIDNLKPVLHLHRMHYKMQSGTGALFIIGDCLRRPFLIRLRRLRPTMSSVLSEDELAWKWAALLVAVIGVPIYCKPQSSSVRSDVVSSPWRRQSSASPAVPISGYCWGFCTWDGTSWPKIAKIMSLPNQAMHRTSVVACCAIWAIFNNESWLCMCA